MAAAAGVAVSWSVDRLRMEFSQEAMAAEVHEVDRSVRMPPRPVSPRTELPLVAVEDDKGDGTFLGVSDEELLAPLRAGTPVKVKFNHGGSSISLRVDFDNGARAAFKPQQTNLQSVPRREVVAFRLNRLLGLSSVPPAIGAAFSMDELLSVLHPESMSYRPRLQAEMVQTSGYVRGELSWWIPVIDRGKVGGYEMDSMEGIVTWKRYLSLDGRIPDDELPLVRQISDMVLFDFLTDNPDRWSGGNARVSEDGSVLYFMDNTLSFGTSAYGRPKSRTYLERCQKFSRRLVERLRSLREDKLREELGKDMGPFDYLLNDEEIVALMSRRDQALKYIDGLIKSYGESRVLAFP
jgi:hypothetical protein